jgi:hypothetical protein
VACTCACAVVANDNAATKSAAVTTTQCHIYRLERMHLIGQRLRMRGGEKVRWEL